MNSMMNSTLSTTAQRGLRVLVIDDDDVSRDMMVSLLREDGHAVWGVPSPIGATKHILAEDVQVVVIDVMMPSMRGDKLAALLSRNPKLKELGLVLVSGANVGAIDSLAALVRAAAVVDKSAMHEDLIPAVRRSVRRRASDSERHGR
jgi:CheY-like chemotaxis protein